MLQFSFVLLLVLALARVMVQAVHSFVVADTVEVALVEFEAGTAVAIDMQVVAEAADMMPVVVASVVGICSAEVDSSSVAV